jgi:hypothetical protein
VYKKRQLENVISIRAQISPEQTPKTAQIPSDVPRCPLLSLEFEPLKGHSDVTGLPPVSAPCCPLLVACLWMLNLPRSHDSQPDSRLDLPWLRFEIQKRRPRRGPPEPSRWASEGGSTSLFFSNANNARTEASNKTVFRQLKKRNVSPCRFVRSPRLSSPSR